MSTSSHSAPLGVLYAMEAEAAGLLRALGGRPLAPVAGVGLYTLSGGHILCVGGVGKVNTAMAAQLLIDRFSVRGVLNAGCAGALEPLPVGTVVAARFCVQHDVDTTLAGDPPGLVSTVNTLCFPCRLPALAGVTAGVVATGDWFGRDYSRAQAIRDGFGATVCDMEAGAVAQVCLRHRLPCVVLKSVSDHLFAPDQAGEYRDNLPRAMESLDAAVTACLAAWP